MRVVEPVTILNQNIVESNLFSVRPVAYAAGITYTLGAYVSVVGAFGEILIYQSLQSGNIGNTPSSSPTWWVYSQLIYEQYSVLEMYDEGVRVRSPLSATIYESLSSGNICNPLSLNEPHWIKLGMTPESGVANLYLDVTYSLGDFVKIVVTFVSVSSEPAERIVRFYRSLTNGNIGNIPPEFGNAYWEIVTTPALNFEANKVYKLNQIVLLGGVYYKSTINNNIGTPLVTTTQWVKVSPDNRTAMFDNQSFTTSVANKAITSTISTGIIDTVALINVSADMATVTVRNGLGGDIIYTKTAGLTGGNPTNAWDYYFSDPLLRTNQYIFDDIPPFSNSHVTLELTGGAEVSIGNLIVGKSKDLGLSVYGAQAGILDFSTKTTDFFGNTLFTKRGYKKTLSIQTEVKKEKINQVQRLLYNLRTIPALWISTTDTELSEPLVLFGFYKDFSTTISYPTHALCSLEIEGLV